MKRKQYDKYVAMCRSHGTQTINSYWQYCHAHFMNAYLDEISGDTIPIICIDDENII